VTPMLGLETWQKHHFRPLRIVNKSARRAHTDPIVNKFQLLKL